MLVSFHIPLLFNFFFCNHIPYHFNAPYSVPPVLGSNMENIQSSGSMVKNNMIYITRKTVFLLAITY